MELRQFLRTLRRRWKFIVAVFLLGVVAAGAVTSLIAPKYASESRVYVTATSRGAVDAYQMGIYASTRAATYAELATDPAVLQRVVDRAGLDRSVEELAGQVQVESTLNSVTILVTATDESPEVATRIAAAEAQELVRLVERLETPQSTPDADDDEARSPIVARIAGEASFSSNPVSPNIPLNIAVGALLGLLLGIAGAILRDLVDTSIKSAEDLAAVSDSALIGLIPFDPSVSKEPLISDITHTPRAEAFRVMRTNLQFADLDARRQMIMVSSALPDEGKTMTSVSLAISLAQIGRRVLLIDCDLRKPQVADVLGLENGAGLLSVLVGRTTLEQCIQPHSSGIDFLGTGPQPPNPAEVLNTNSMRDLLAQVRDQYEIVIVDVPPLLPVADPAIVATMVDGVVMVIRHGKTGRALVRQAVERLESVGAPIIGTVLNRAPARVSYGYGTGYGYGYGYGPEVTAGPARVEKPAGRGSRRKNADAELPRKSR